MDTDFHKVFDSRNIVVNKDKRVLIKNDVWIGARTIVFKGTVIESGIIIGAGSILRGSYKVAGSIYSGKPAEFLSTGITWAI